MAAALSAPTEIAKRVEEYSRSAGLSVVELFEQAKRIAFSDTRQLFDENGRLLQHPITDIATRARGQKQPFVNRAACWILVQVERPSFPNDEFGAHISSVPTFGLGSFVSC
jgi:hypothetical protein